MSFNRRSFLLLIPAAIGALLTGNASAQSVEQFYKGKQIRLTVGSAPAGAYDVYSRRMAPYFTKYIPGNPHFVVENRPGGGGLLSSNFLFNTAPKDGSFIAMVERGAAMDPLINGAQSQAKFDPLKFNWIGSPTQEIGIGLMKLPSPIKSAEDLRSKELIVSATTNASTAAIYPKIMNGLFGTKFKIVQGYKGSVEALAAVEKGEVDGYLNGASSGVMRAQISPWIEANKAKVFLIFGFKKDPAYPDAFMVADMAKTDEEKQMLTLMFAQQIMAYPFVAPPDMPMDRFAALRDAFDKTVADPDFLADAAKMKLSVDPVSGKEIRRLIADMYDTPKPIVDRYAKLSAAD